MKNPELHNFAAYNTIWAVEFSVEQLLETQKKKVKWLPFLQTKRRDCKPNKFQASLLKGNGNMKEQYTLDTYSNPVTSDKSIKLLGIHI